tara:strand:+ start:532 stop:891 length:360 start_codon:yes stop_codon:yes gene_type:complete
MANEEKQQIELVTVTLDEGVIKPIVDQNSKLNQAVNSFGQLYIREKELGEELELLHSDREKLENDFKSDNEEMRKMIGTLEKEYPRGQLDLQNGTITYNPAVLEQMKNQDIPASELPKE